MVYRALKTAVGKAAVATAFAALLGLATDQRATAQVVEWESTFSPGRGDDAARGGVIAHSNGDIVAAGECEYQGRKDVYVAKTDPCSFPLFVNRYNLGGDDIGRKVRATADGGYIVVGTTNNRENCGTVNDIFLLKLDANGVPLWAKTYGGTGNDEGWDVQVAEDGYVVAGRTTSFGSGNEDAFLMKTDLSGVEIWAKMHGTIRNEYYNSCVITDNGEIVATGARETADGTTDIYLVRHGILGGVMFAMTVTGPQNDVGWRVLECTNNDIALAGVTVNANGKSEGYLARLTSAFSMIVDRRCESPGSTGDEFFDMTEIPYDHFLVTGTMAGPQGGHGGTEMYVGEYDGNLNLLNDEVHGGTQSEEGWGITFVPNPMGLAEYAAAGMTDSYGFGGPELYMVRQRLTGGGCAAAVVVNTTEPEYYLTPVYDTELHVDNLGCSVTPTYSYNGLHSRPCDHCNWYLPKVSDGTVSPEGSDAMRLYPNPLKAGENLNFHLPGSSKTQGTLTVSDITGTIVHTAPVTGGETSIPTDGWAAGTYIIYVKGAGVEYSGRVVLGTK
jgi:hypothetical protein